MKKKSLITMILLFALLLCSCKPASTPQPAKTEVINTEAPMPTATNTLEPTTTSEPTDNPQQLFTPTAPAQWFEPGFSMEQSDYEYYHELMLITGDTTDNTSVTFDVGVNIQECETCELAVNNYLEVTYLPKSSKSAIFIYIYRYPDAEEAVQSIQQHVEEFSTAGFSATAAPATTNAELVTTYLAGSGGLITITPYGALEILLYLTNLNDLSSDEGLQILTELLDAQVAKLQAAGY